MVSDSELIDRLQKFLRTADLNTTTPATVRRTLEEDLGIDLSDKKAFIREQIDLFLQIHVHKTEDDEAEEKDEEEEAEDEKPNIKSEANNDSEEESEAEAEAEAEAEVEEEEEEEEEDEEEEEESSNGKGRKKGVAKKQKKDVKRRGGGFTKLCSLSPQLQKFVGVPELARTEVVRQLWTYIRENNLQDPKNRRNIICDEALHDIFRVGTINMFQMNKVLSKHIWPLDSEDGVPDKSNQKEKQRKKERREDPDEPKPKEKKQKGGGSGFLAPLPLSDALVKFIGTGESALSRSDVVKRMWDYIKQKNLQDPSDKRRIICDDKLKELFDVDTFTGFTVSKLLTVHFIKSEQRAIESQKKKSVVSSTIPVMFL